MFWRRIKSKQPREKRPSEEPEKTKVPVLVPPPKTRPTKIHKPARIELKKTRKIKNKELDHKSHTAPSKSPIRRTSMQNSPIAKEKLPTNSGMKKVKPTPNSATKSGQEKLPKRSKIKSIKRTDSKPLPKTNKKEPRLRSDRLSTPRKIKNKILLVKPPESKGPVKSPIERSDTLLIANQPIHDLPQNTKTKLPPASIISKKTPTKEPKEKHPKSGNIKSKKPRQKQPR